VKHQTILAVLALSVLLGALQSPAQTPAYHALLLGISDGRTNIQVEHPTGMNQWGQVVGYYGGGLSGRTTPSCGRQIPPTTAVARPLIVRIGLTGGFLGT
jgi:hypothetical protein